jgi:hypothetical protein
VRRVEEVWTVRSAKRARRGVESASAGPGQRSRDGMPLAMLVRGAPAAQRRRLAGVGYTLVRCGTRSHHSRPGCRAEKATAAVRLRVDDYGQKSQGGAGRKRKAADRGRRTGPSSRARCALPVDQSSVSVCVVVFSRWIIPPGTAAGGAGTTTCGCTIVAGPVCTTRRTIVRPLSISYSTRTGALRSAS